MDISEVKMLLDVAIQCRRISPSSTSGGEGSKHMPGHEFANWQFEHHGATQRDPVHRTIQQGGFISNVVTVVSEPPRLSKMGCVTVCAYHGTREAGSPPIGLRDFTVPTTAAKLQLRLNQVHRLAKSEAREVSQVVVSRQLP
jgi:hypothetical protein